jgi:ligand-binding sensor domain-containing protein
MKISGRIKTFLSAVLGLASAAAWAGPGDWEHFRAFGGRTAAGEVKTLIADARYLYAFSAEGGLRYDRLMEKWDFGFMGRAPDFAYDFSALDQVTGDIYFISGNRAVPYHPASDIYYGGMQFPGRIQEIAFAPDRIWAKTNTGHYSCDRFTKTVQSEKEPPAGLDWFGQINIKSLRQDARLAFLSPFLLMDRYAELHPLTAVVLEPATSNVWVAYRGMGLWRYDRLTRRGSQVTRGFLASSDVRAAFTSQGRLALGGSGGVTVIDDGGANWQQMDRLFNLDLASYQINCLAFDRKNLFIGTSQGLICLAQGENYASVIGTYDGLRHQDIKCLDLEGDSLWIGTPQGPALYVVSANAVAGTWPELDRFEIRGVAAAEDKIYLATDRGAVVLEGADTLRPRWLESPEAPELVRELAAVVFDGQVLWWLAPEALLGLDIRTKRWTRFMAAGNYLAGKGTCLAADSLNIWVGTDAGLARYFRDHDRWYVYHPDDGLMDDRVWAVCSHEGFVWAGGPRGVSRFRWAR